MSPPTTATRNTRARSFSPNPNTPRGPMNKFPPQLLTSVPTCRQVRRRRHEQLVPSRLEVSANDVVTLPYLDELSFSVCLVDAGLFIWVHMRQDTHIRSAVRNCLVANRKTHKDGRQGRDGSTQSPPPALPAVSNAFLKRCNTIVNTDGVEPARLAASGSGEE